MRKGPFGAYEVYFSLCFILSPVFAKRHTFLFYLQRLRDKQQVAGFVGEALPNSPLDTKPVDYLQASSPSW
jgi:hypothetical protein